MCFPFFSKNKVGERGVGECRGGRFVPGTKSFQELENLPHEPPRNRVGKLREKDNQLGEMRNQLTDVLRQPRETGGQLRNSNVQPRDMKSQLTDVQWQLQERDGQLTEKDCQLGKRDEQLREMRNQLTDVRRQLQERDKQLTEKDRQLRERDEQLREMRNQLTNVRRQLQERDGQLRNRNRQVREIIKKFTSVHEQLQGKSEEFTSLEIQLTAKQLEIKELEKSLSEVHRVLDERSRHQTPDWIIPRDQIQLTDKCLGKGGWGSVVEGKYCGCVVAVKQIHELVLSDHNRRLFEREMSIAARCRHPCLLQFIGATNDEGSPLFVTELMESSLRALLEQRPLSSLEVSVISLDVARALNYLHLKKPSPIIHRDISSANVLLWRQADQWRGKVSDYGTANFTQDNMTACPGSRIYSAPEALTEKQTAKVCVHLYVGVIFLDCLFMFLQKTVW